jgi:uncharacterized protein Yka (UPF0111/DUF47 family)
MLRYFLPAQEDFFELFRKIAAELSHISKQFQILLNNLETSQEYVIAIEEHEEKVNIIINMTLEKLHKTFITPFDRYDIHRFVKKLDDTADAIQRTAKRIHIYKLKSLPKEIHAIAELSHQSAEVIQNATANLNSLNNASKILELCDAVNRFEKEAEKLLLSGVSRLFEEESDMRQLLKIKEIYEYSKSILNGCQTVSNIIKDIVLEYS